MKRENSPDPAAAKAEIRRRMQASLRSFSPATRARASLEICRLAAGWLPWSVTPTVALFAPLSSEPDIHPLIEEAWARRRRVVFPLMLRAGDAPRLQWHEVTNWEEMIVAGPFGLREPDPVRCPRVQPADIGAIFVPGLAFDDQGGRLGRGGGYYDAALAEFKTGTPTLGLFFARQKIERVPREEHDRPLQNVLTEKGFLQAVG